MVRRKSFFDSFRSGLEGLASDYLRTREGKFGYRTSYERLKLDYKIEATYTPDFDLVFPNGHVRIIETKGYFDAPSRRKMAAVKENNPGLDICILFAKDNFLKKGAKSRYSDWCKKIGYPYAVKVCPVEWLESQENILPPSGLVVGCKATKG